MDRASDAQLVRWAIAGRAAAFVALQRRYDRRVFRKIRGITGNDADAEDACQDAWLLALCHLADLEDGTKFSTWIARIAARCASARMRSRWQLVSFNECDAHLSDHDAPDLEWSLDTRRLWRRVEQAMDDLPPRHRAVVLLRDFAGLTTTEVADVLGSSEENVRVRLHRARANLRQLSERRRSR